MTKQLVFNINNIEIMRKILSLLMLFALFACTKDEMVQKLAVQNTDSDFKFYGIKYVDKPQTRGVALKDNLWENGQTIKIKFLNGSETQKGKVKEFAAEWLEYANLNFEYVTGTEKSDVRIAFDYPGEDFTWSCIGTDAKYVSQSLPTTHFKKIGTSDKLIKREVLMQFGHILGLVNEHQGPNNPIEWDYETTYEILMDEGRSIAQIKDILRQYSCSASNYTEFDPKSIMVWPVEDIMTLNDQSYTRNSVLSEMDKKFIAELYPKSKYTITETNIPVARLLYCYERVYWFDKSKGIKYFDKEHNLVDVQVPENNSCTTYHAIGGYKANNSNFLYVAKADLLGNSTIYLLDKYGNMRSTNIPATIEIFDSKSFKVEANNRIYISYINKIDSYKGELYYAEMSDPTNFYKIEFPILPSSVYSPEEMLYSTILDPTVDKLGNIYFSYCNHYRSKTDNRLILAEEATAYIDKMHNFNIIQRHSLSIYNLLPRIRTFVTTKDSVVYGTDFGNLLGRFYNGNMQVNSSGNCLRIEKSPDSGIVAFCRSELLGLTADFNVKTIVGNHSTELLTWFTSKEIFCCDYLEGITKLYNIKDNETICEDTLINSLIEAYGRVYVVLPGKDKVVYFEF